MTLTFTPGLDSIKMNKHAKYLGQGSFSSKVIVRTRRHTNTQIRLTAVPGPLK